ncbi:MAG: Mfa1 family fimbria major subunit [Bacteroidaceae bacterium]|nr:Mfa1 family fimbria major subunit [Bacteroidaceae bacterium]
MSVLASLFLAGCSQEQIAPNGEGNGSGEANTSYMAVNLVSANAMGTRAAQGYEDGNNAENKVTSVRFYFFNGVGGAVNVKLQNGSYVNYYDWTPEEGDQSGDTNNGDDIESKLKATIVINTAEGDGIPQRVAAVLNPTGLDNASKSLTDLKAVFADYADSGLTSEGTFVMFNSVGGEGKNLSTTLIEDKNLCKTKEDALAHPVTIHVERSVAKVRITLDKSIGFDNDNKLALKDKDGNDLKVGGEQVYLQLDGWGLSAETSEGRLVKKINPAWEGTWWYTSHRSFWAINSMNATNRYHMYNDIKTSFGKDNALYTNENAQLTDINGSEGKAKKRTKFILKGKLCKADGTPFTIVRHLGVHFADTVSKTEAENLTELKKSILNQLTAGGYNYYYPTESGRAEIGVDDLEILVAPQVEDENSQNNCYVYAQLTDDAAAKTWYRSLEEGETAIEEADKEINGKLANEEIVDKALVWNSGMTYYYSEIKHLNSLTGVVRNHIYGINVTKIAGLGTPVYDPTKVIYPEQPKENDHFIAAQIDILSWRVVNEDYELEW